MNRGKEGISLTSSPAQQSTIKDKASSQATQSEQGAHNASIGAQSVLPLAPIPYTIYTQSQKRRLRLLLGFATITSPLTATIYFPLLPLLRTHFDTSAQAINLTLTIYIIFQAVSPAIFGPLSDSIGRRLVYLITLAIYALGNLGLALNKSSYAVLLVLRAFQSLGASAALAVSYGVVADICVPSERGRMLGPVSMALNLGACVGPVVGGVVAWTSGSYEWVFWSLVIVGVTLWVGVGLFLPETGRVLVGNGSRSVERRWWEESCYFFLKRRLFDGSLKTEKSCRKSENGQSRALPPRKTFWEAILLHNPLACLRVMFHLDTFFVLWMVGSFYVVDYTVVAAMPDIFKDIYHFNELQIGLTYIPRGVGIITGGYCTGKLMDYNYKTVARNIGWNVDEVAGDNLQHFPDRTGSGKRQLLPLNPINCYLGRLWLGNGKACTSCYCAHTAVHSGFYGHLLLQHLQRALGGHLPREPKYCSSSIKHCTLRHGCSGCGDLVATLECIGQRVVFHDTGHLEWWLWGTGCSRD